MGTDPGRATPADNIIFSTASQREKQNARPQNGPQGTTDWDHFCLNQYARLVRRILSLYAIGEVKLGRLSFSTDVNGSCYF
jgi:hypothetical protein